MLERIKEYRNLFSIISPINMFLILLAKLPYTMFPLGILICVRYATDSIVIAGFSTACLSFASAFSSLLISKYCDIFGARKIISFILPVTVISLFSLTVVLASNYPSYIIYINCILIGASMIPIGSITRAIWIRNSASYENIQLALSYESSTDELLYVLGPTLVGIISSFFGEFVLLVTMATLVMVFNTVFILSLLRKVDYKTNTKTQLKDKNNISIFKTLKAVYMPIFSIASIGIFFGAMQVSITEIANVYGSSSYAGLSYATIGISSSIAAMLLVALPVTLPLWDRQILFSIFLFLSTLPCLFITSLPWVTVFLFILGTFIGPCLVTIFSIGELLSKQVSLQIAMAAICSSIIVGNAIGSSIAGQIASIYNGNTSLVICLLSCVICIAMGLMIKIKMTKRDSITYTCNK